MNILGKERLKSNCRPEYYEFKTTFVIPNEVMHGNALLMTGIPIQATPPDSNINKYWYDTSSGKATLKLYDGASWIEVKLGGSGEDEGVYVKLTGNQTIGGIKTFTSNIIGNVTGNIVGNVTGNLNGHATSSTSATNATNATKLTTPRTINGVSFDGSSNITITNVANATNATSATNASTVTNGVYTTGNQTIGGIKTFTSSPKAPTPATSDNSTNIATTQFVKNLIGGGTIGVVPSGAIIMWSGSIATIPSGWALCNGANGTPDLRNRFVIGSSSDVSGVSNTSVTGANTKSGGSKDAIVVSHTHSGTANSGSGGGTFITGLTTYYSTPPAGYTPIPFRCDSGVINWGYSSASSAAHTHNVTINSTGSSGTNANLPPYYALAFIMKL